MAHSSAVPRSGKTGVMTCLSLPAMERALSRQTMRTVMLGLAAFIPGGPSWSNLAALSTCSREKNFREKGKRMKIMILILMMNMMMMIAIMMMTRMMIREHAHIT